MATQHGERDAGGDAARQAAARAAANQMPKPRVVEAHLGDAAPAGDRERVTHQSLIQPVGRLPDPAHHIQRQLAAMPDEAHDRREPALGRAGQQIQIAGVHPGVKCAHPHGKPENSPSLDPPGLLDGIDLSLQRGVDLPSLVGPHAPPESVQAVYRLPQLAHGSARERESGRIDHRLLADAQRPQAEAVIQLEMTRGCPVGDYVPALLRGEPQEAFEHHVGGTIGRHGIAGDDRRPPHRAVGQHAAAG